MGRHPQELLTPVLHDDELPVDEVLVRGLLGDQLPHLGDLPLRRLTTGGSSNLLLGLGEDLLVRMPRQPGGSATITKEATWGPVVAPWLPVPTPSVVAVGEPGRGYPERWAVVGRLDGDLPAVRRGGGAVPAADLAAVLAGLRSVPVPPEALEDPALRWYRGDPLRDCAEDGREALAACRGLDLDLDLDRAAVLLDRLVAVPQPRRTSWLHGDLLAENLLVRDGRLAAVLDLGGLAVGDPAVDLVAAWELLDAPGRAHVRDALDLGEEEWLVGAGWALLLALITFPCYAATMPGRCADRLVMAQAVIEELG